MIKIFEIQPYDSKSKYRNLKEIELDYLQKFRVYSQPEVLLELFLTTGQHNRFSITTTTEIDILEYLLSNFPQIVTGRPEKLNSIINLFNAKGWDHFITANDKLTGFGIALLDVFGYEDRFRGNLGRGIWLSKQLNIKSCPYCNAQYTILAEDENNKEILKFQFDHFFPQRTYPYLSISLYNLIPACANCNIVKSSKIPSLRNHYHPYLMDLSKLAEFKFKYKPDPSKLTLNTVKNQDLSIEFVPRFEDKEDIVGIHDRLYHITGVYNRHQDVAEELLLIAVIHTKGLIRNHMAIEGLFPDRNTYYRYLLRNYYFHKDTLNRPLAKFTQDLARQLKLI